MCPRGRHRFFLKIKRQYNCCKFLPQYTPDGDVLFTFSSNILVLYKMWLNILNVILNIDEDPMTHYCCSCHGMLLMELEKYMATLK